MSVVKNETLKLIANWCNAASVTLGGTGVLVPILSRYYRIGPELQDTESIWGLVILCGGLSLSLHLLGQLFLGGLDE
ncbi:hypothetical protein [Tardiphaga sp. 768_D3_N2_1]|uniref:hypothetical protein n=1 Tax=Tardiphaga sp. 768_D3_N2_1 TaxID=3240783 RepID=UPI003F893C40